MKNRLMIMVAVVAVLIAGGFGLDALLSKPQREILVAEDYQPMAAAEQVSGDEDMMTPMPGEETPETEAKHKPQLYDADGGPVSPLCFLHNLGTEDAPIYPTKDCSQNGQIRVTETAPLNERFVGTYYEDHSLTPEDDAAYMPRGFIGYRAVGQVNYEGGSYTAVVVLENGGGSGLFTSIMLLDMQYDEDSQQRVFAQKVLLSGGDRCMGGYEDARVEDGNLIFRVRATMADMFSLVGNPERAILKTEAAQNLPYCAVCCYADVTYDLEGLRGVSFPPGRDQPQEHNGEAAQCIEELVALNAEHGQDYFNTEAFKDFVRELEHVCLGRMEGEE